MFAYQRHQEKTKPLQALDKPSLFKADGRARATAGVFLWTEQGHELWFLFGEEREERAFSELSGHVEGDSSTSYESFLSAAKRECLEESAGLYDLSEAYLLAEGLIFQEAHDKRQVLMFLIEAPQYHSRQALNAARQKSHHAHFQEKSDYVWVRARDLLALTDKQARYHVTVLGEGQQILRFRDHCLKMMCQTQFKTLVQQLLTQQQQQAHERLLEKPKLKA